MMDRQYVEQVPYRGFVLAGWKHSLPGADPPVTVLRWDVLSADQRLLHTASDRQHAESYVDHLQRRERT